MSARVGELVVVARERLLPRRGMRRRVLFPSFLPLFPSLCNPLRIRLVTFLLPDVDWVDAGVGATIALLVSEEWEAIAGDGDVWLAGVTN